MTLDKFARTTGFRISIALETVDGLRVVLKHLIKVRILDFLFDRELDGDSVAINR
ncbi:hypothetical protein [Haloferax sp. DFSO52]|uniref:hypothetical protein n=1 Tax=Haloferax sp. DFSO52 TaxID=3388505 RepID=UPI003A8701A9